MVTTWLVRQAKNADAHEIEALNSTRETRQFFSAFCAYSSKATAVTFEIDASISGLMLWVDRPTACFWKWAFAVV